MIRDGLAYLDASKSAGRLSRYHLEAGIAAAPSWHACDWNAIVSCYDRLQRIVDSPVVCG